MNTGSRRSLIASLEKELQTHVRALIRLALPGKRSGLAERMARDEAFRKGAEEGRNQVLQGRYSKLDDVKRRLGDV